MKLATMLIVTAITIASADYTQWGKHDRSEQEALLIGYQLATSDTTDIGHLKDQLTVYYSVKENRLHELKTAIERCIKIIEEMRR
jgi:hypothetical protein